MPVVTTIRLRRDFLAAAASGNKFITNSFIVQHRAREAAHPVPEGLIRFGFTATKKLGGAVVRNRTKRRLREAVRTSALPLAAAGHDYVIIARSKALTCDFTELERDMRFAFSRIGANKKPLHSKHDRNEAAT